MGCLRSGAPLALLAGRGLPGTPTVILEAADGLEDGGGRHVRVESLGDRGGVLCALAPGLERARGCDVGGADGHELVDVAANKGGGSGHCRAYAEVCYRLRLEGDDVSQRMRR